jgi:hypothetical protein
MTPIQEITTTVLGLPVRDRVHLVESWLASLPDAWGDASEVADLAEAERRDREIESGRVQPLGETEFWRASPLAPGFSPVIPDADAVSRFNGFAPWDRPQTAEAVLAARQAATPG